MFPACLFFANAFTLVCLQTHLPHKQGLQQVTVPHVSNMVVIVHCLDGNNIYCLGEYISNRMVLEREHLRRLQIMLTLHYY